jgi:hypothetical protein
MWKFSINHSSTITKYWIVYVLIYYNKCKMKFMSNDFNILKVNGSILIIKNMWKKSLIHCNINVRFKIITCVLIYYGKCKKKLLNNGFNILKVDSSIHVPCW